MRGSQEGWEKGRCPREYHGTPEVTQMNMYRGVKLWYRILCMGGRGSKVRDS